MLTLLVATAAVAALAGTVATAATTTTTWSSSSSSSSATATTTSTTNVWIQAGCFSSCSPSTSAAATDDARIRKGEPINQRQSIGERRSNTSATTPSSYAWFGESQSVHSCKSTGIASRFCAIICGWIILCDSRWKERYATCSQYQDETTTVG